MILQLEVEIQIAAAPRTRLQIALALQAQAAAAFNPRGYAHLHPLVVHSQGAFATMEGIGKAEADRGLSIEIHRRLSPSGKTRTKSTKATWRPVTPRPAKASTAPTHPAQEVVDEVVEIAVIGAIPIRAARAASLIPVLAELLIAGPLVGIGEHLIGLAHLLELGLGPRIAGVHIRVVLAGQLAKSPLNGVIVGPAINAQHLEVIAVAVGAHRFPGHGIDLLSQVHGLLCSVGKGRKPEREAVCGQFPDQPGNPPTVKVVFQHPWHRLAPCAPAS